MKEIQLTQGKVALVDDEDFDRVNMFNWHACLNRHVWYARRSEWPSLKAVRMHSFVLALHGSSGSVQIDHRDGNGLNNQKSNLRVATRAQNQINRGLPCNNTSGFKGVYRKGRSWVARLHYNGSKISLGSYADPAEAARAYDRKARELFGEFAWLNFPKGNNSGSTTA